MRKSRTTSERSFTLAAAGLALAAVPLLAACTSAPATSAESDTPSASATASPAATATATPTPEPTPRIPDDLAIPLEGIGAWAAATVPTTGAAGYEFGQSGWLDPEARSMSITGSSLAPATYIVTVACLGEGSLVATVTADDGSELAPATPVDCTATPTPITVTTTAAGVTTNLLSDEDATAVYAIAIQGA